MALKRTEEFIEEANKIHKGIYDYSRTEYIRAREKLKIICSKHGEFEQIASSHLSGQGCRKCGHERAGEANSKPISFYIKKFKKAHGEKYKYIESSYSRSSIPMKIVCPTHGEFEQRPEVHLKGHGCPACGGFYKFDTHTFIEKAKSIHGDLYDYSLVEYTKSSRKVTIICKVHGAFEQIANSHLLGMGCAKCGFLKTADHHALDTSEFIEKAKKVHGNFYDYRLSKYKRSSVKLSIVCPVHGGFKQTPNIHLRGAGCSKCAASEGEKRIDKFLASMGVQYEWQKKFEGCVHKQKLAYDFFIPSLNTLIEYDGLQHFVGSERFGGEKQLNLIKKCDNIKTEFAKEKGIRLIRITYKQLHRIEEILSSLLK